MAFNPIALFVKIVPDDIVNAFNTLINEINGDFQALGFGYAGTVTLRQFKLALAASNLNSQVIAGIPASADDATYIAWTSASNVVPNDVLATNVKTTLGYTDAQMAALFALAETLTP